MPTSKRLCLNNQKGVAPIALVVVAVVVIAAAGGFFLMNKGGSAPSIPGVPAGLTLNPNCKYNDPDLCKFVNNWKVIKDYSTKSTMTDKNGTKSESLYEISGEDKFHMQTLENGKENYNVITIGDTTYTKDYSDNKWWKQVAKKEDNLKDQVEIKFDDENTVEDKTTYKQIGKESCEKNNCFKYQVIDPSNTDSTDYIWFDDKDYLLRRMRSESKSGEVVDSTISYDRINISAPSPTKDAKPDQIITPQGAVPGLSESEKKELEKASEEAKNFLESLPQEPVGEDYSVPADSGE